MDRLIVLAQRDLYGAPVAVDRPGVTQRLRWSLSPGAGKVFGKRGRRGQRERAERMKGDRHLGGIVDRHRVPLGIPESEGATKRAVKRVRQDRDPAPGELVMQGLGVIDLEPERDAEAGLTGVQISVGQWLANGERDRFA